MMERRGTGDYVYLGTAVRFLMDVRTGMEIFHDGGVVENIKNMHAALEEYEFHVTRRLCGRLMEMVSDWEDERESHSDDVEWEKSRTLSRDEDERLVRAAGHVRETLLAEAAGKIAFIATDKRYTVEKLIDNVGSLMGQGVYDALPYIAQTDFAEGGRAIAFDLPTAAGFHLLRGTEAALRDFYCRVVRRGRIPEPRMWAALVRDLRGKRNGPSDLLLDNLDSLRANFRNPTQHPEMVYEIDEVQDLFALVIDSLNRMHGYLASHALAGTATHA